MDPPPPPLPPPPLVPPLVRSPFAWWDAHPPALMPGGVSSPPSTITFCHPGYPEQDNILFQLPALDTRAGSHPTGIHHGLALTACFIIAANTPGCLSVSRDPAIALTAPVLPWDHVLTAPVYYFHTTDGNDATPYPICPDFASWRFPHNRLPEQWSSPTPEAAEAGAPLAPRALRPVPASNMSAAVINRDESCRVTDCRAGLNNSHIVPREEIEWFGRNKMHVYNANHTLSPSHLTNDIRNGFALRSDLNGPAFDAAKFAIVPKEGKLAIHFLHDAFELVPLYHNREAHPIPVVSREFLFTRFAWALFPRITGFLTGLPTRLRLYTLEAGRWAYVDQELDWGAKQQQAAASKSKSKRKRGSGTATSSSVGDFDILPASPDLGIAAHSSPGALEDYFNPPLCEREREEQELREDYEIQAEAFPEMVHESESGTSRVWEDITWYPGVRKVERMKEAFRRDRGWVNVLAKRRKYGVEG